MQLADDGNVGPALGRFHGGAHAGQATTDDHDIVLDHVTFFILPAEPSPKDLSGTASRMGPPDGERDKDAIDRPYVPRAGRDRHRPFHGRRRPWLDSK